MQNNILCTVASPCVWCVAWFGCCSCTNVGDACSEGRNAAVGQSTTDVMGPGVLAPRTCVLCDDTGDTGDKGGVFTPPPHAPLQVPQCARLVS